MIGTVPTRDELLRQASALDAEAGAALESSAHSATLRRQAAELRLQALGEKPYPVLMCGACFCLTGWLDSNGVCAIDAMRRQEQEATGLRDVRDLRVRAPTAREPLARRIRRALGVATRRDRAREWLKRVEPDETGPIEPEESWEIEAPTKYEWPAPEGPHLLVCFDVESLRFEDSAWRRIGTSRGGKPRTLVPRQFSASIPIDQLAEAWNDFEEEVAAHNRGIWQAESERRAARSEAAAERRAAAELEHGTDRLLG
jgi:hypothetical protein